MHFAGYELELKIPEQREQIVSALERASDRPLLVLNTCQRLECYGFGEPASSDLTIARKHEHAFAFERLARIAAGLESRILGELEVLGQVREAYRRFVTSGGCSNTTLDRVFQDALSLARKARRESGIDRQLTSLGSVAARELLARVPAGQPLAVVGSGDLAGKVARYLGERGKAPIRVVGRCPENAVSLAQKVGGFGAGLDQLAPQLEGVVGIVTATAAPHPVLYAHHLTKARCPLAIVDLGVPPDCADDVRRMDSLTYLGLADVEAKVQCNEAERRACAEKAAVIIREGAKAWAAGS